MRGRQRTFGTFPKIHPFWRRQTSLIFGQSFLHKESCPLAIGGLQYTAAGGFLGDKPSGRYFSPSFWWPLAHAVKPYRLMLNRRRANDAAGHLKRHLTMRIALRCECASLDLPWSNVADVTFTLTGNLSQDIAQCHIKSRHLTMAEEIKIFNTIYRVKRSLLPNVAEDWKYVFFCRCVVHQKPFLGTLGCKTCASASVRRGAILSWQPNIL